MKILQLCHYITNDRRRGSRRSGKAACTTLVNDKVSGINTRTESPERHSSPQNSNIRLSTGRVFFFIPPRSSHSLGYYALL